MTTSFVADPNEAIDMIANFIIRKSHPLQKLGIKRVTRAG